MDGKLFQANNLFLPTRYVQFLVFPKDFVNIVPTSVPEKWLPKKLRSFLAKHLSQNVNKANVTIAISLTILMAKLSK